jgi:hypothetical protein
MPKQAQLEDGTILEFPDDTPDDVIDRAVRSHLGVESPKAWEPKKRSVADLRAAAAQYQAAHPVTDDMSFAQQVVAGYGKSYMDTWRGAKQLVGQEDVAGIEDSRAMDAALDDSPGGRTGKIAGQTVQIATPIPGSAAVKATAWAGRAAPYVGAAARAGAFGALQPTGLGESRAANAAESAAWGAAGQGVASGLGYLAKGAKNALAEPVRRSIDAAKRAGIPLHVSQVTNSPFLKTLSSTINSVLPFTGAQKAGQRQQEAFMRAISRTFGMDAPALTDDVMKAAKGRIGQAYDAIFSRNKVDLRNQDIQKLVQIERAARQDLTEESADVVSRQLKKIIDDFGNGPISGSRYQDLRASLQNAVDGTKTGAAVKALRAALDDAAHASVGPQDAAALRQLNGMYANFRTAQEALRQAAGAGGNINPANLWNLVRNGSTKDMRELAQIGKNVLQNPIPNSGTAQRDLILRGLAAVGGGSMTGVGAPAMLKGAGLGAIAGRVLNSPRAAEVLGQGKPLSGLARLMAPSGRVLPAIAGSSPAILAAKEPEQFNAELMQALQSGQIDEQQAGDLVGQYLQGRPGEGWELSHKYPAWLQLYQGQ